MNSIVEDVPLLNLPDIRILLDSEMFLCSSAGEYDQERLDFFAKTIYPYWQEQACGSLHQLAEHFKPLGIELWTAKDVRITLPNEFAFNIYFTKEYPGRVLVQCEIDKQERIH